MDRGGVIGSLELRREGGGSRRLHGSFPYGKRAVLSAGGNGRRPQKEQFEPGAFSFALDDPEREIHLLIGHSFDRPLASRKAGSLVFDDTEEALNFEAVIDPEIAETSYARDFFAGLSAGLIAGISPGFRIPPKDVVPGAVRTIEENPDEGKALIRLISAAVLFEMSAVVRPAYDETTLEERQWGMRKIAHPTLPALRWRA